MHTVTLDTKEASNKWFALQDRRIRNHVNKTLYTQTQQIRMERIKLALELVIRGTVYDVGYGKRSAAVKVQAGAFVADRKMLALLEDDWTQEGIFKKKTSQGWQYHLTRA